MTGWMFDVTWTDVTGARHHVTRKAPYPHLRGSRWLMDRLGRQARIRTTRGRMPLRNVRAPLVISPQGDHPREV